MMVFTFNRRPVVVGPTRELIGDWTKVHLKSEVDPESPIDCFMGPVTRSLGEAHALARVAQAPTVTIKLDPVRKLKGIGYTALAAAMERFLSLGDQTDLHAQRLGSQRPYFIFSAVRALYDAGFPRAALSILWHDIGDYKGSGKDFKSLRAKAERQHWGER